MVCILHLKHEKSDDMNHNSSTLVMGAAIGYQPNQIEPFISSLRNAGYKGDVLLLVSPAVKRRLANSPLFIDVRLVAVRQWFPVRFRLVKQRLLSVLIWAPQRLITWLSIRALGYREGVDTFRERLCLSLGQHLYPPSETRYLHYLQFLHANPAYSRILISDVRDVLFQEDPFEHIPDTGLSVSMEIKKYKIESEPYNAGWVKTLYGESMLRKIGENQVSCSGVSYGDRLTMLRYFQLVVAEILGMNYKAAKTALGGYDQGIHNVLLWTGQLDPVKKMYSLSSPVATINGLEVDELQFNDDGYLVNKDGSKVAVVHQYDRVPNLRDHLISLVIKGEIKSSRIANV